MVSAIACVKDILADWCVGIDPADSSNFQLDLLSFISMRVLDSEKNIAL